MYTLHDISSVAKTIAFVFFFSTGTDQITKLFFYAIAHLVVEPGIYILIRKEVCKMFIMIQLIISVVCH